VTASHPTGHGSGSNSVGGEPPQSSRELQLGPVEKAEGHAFRAFSWRDVTVEGADWAIEMDVTPKVQNNNGVLQGGLLATLIDIAAGLSLLRGEQAYARNVTSEMQVSFLAGARVGPVRAVAHVLRRGRRTAVVRVDVHDVGADDLYVAAATLTFSVTPKDT
jgi:uncharacterized protein (TIGR00369 family)